jgi:FkbM family methyltransferase
MKDVIKWVIRIFSKIIAKNTEALKYLYTSALKDETQNYCDYGATATYPHILKSIRIINKLKLMNFMIVDIGGAQGNTVKMFAKAFPNNRILVFEPIIENRMYLNPLKDEFRNITVVYKALGDNIEQSKMWVTSRVSSSSLLDLVEPNEIESDFMIEALAEKKQITVDVSTLNCEIGREYKNIVLKIDVQGFELKVLQGASEILNEVALIVVEVSNQDVYLNSPKYYDIDNYLRENGFILIDMCLSFREGYLLREWDSLYLRRNLLSKL